MPYINGMYYTQRMYEHVQAVIAVTGAPPAQFADLAPSQLPPPIGEPTTSQQELIDRSAAIVVTEHIYTPPAMPDPSTISALQLLSDQQTQEMQPSDVAGSTSTAATTTTERRYLLEIGYIGNPPDWLATRIMNTIQPIAQRFGWTCTGVAVNPSTIDVVFLAPHNPIPAIMIYAILAVIGAAIVGAVIISIVWTDLAGKEQETFQITSLEDLFVGIQNDPTIDQATKNKLLLDLTNTIGGVADHEEAPFTLGGIKDLMILAIAGSVLMGMMK